MFDIPVLPALASKLSAHMKEKPKLDLSKVIMTPMPGVVTSVEVEEGDSVGLGQGINPPKSGLIACQCWTGNMRCVTA